MTTARIRSLAAPSKIEISFGIAVGFAVGTTSPALATVVALEAAIETSVEAEALGYWTVNLYCVTTSASDQLQQVDKVKLQTSAGMFAQISPDTNAFLPPTLAQVASNPDWLLDSWVTIGKTSGDGNSTAASPCFGTIEFNSTGTLGFVPDCSGCPGCDGAGWFDFMPLNGQGLAGNFPDNKIPIGRFTMPLTTPEGDPATFTVLQMSFKLKGQCCFQSGFTAFAEAPHRRSQFGDLDGDGCVDGADLGALLGAWGEGGPADLDGSGTADGADLGLMLGVWGSGCG